MTDDDLVKGDSFVKIDTGVLDSSLYYVDRRDQRSMFFTAILMAKPFQLTNTMPQLGVRDMRPTGWSVPPGWYGVVRAAGSAIIRRDGVDDERGFAALEALGAPDNDSRSKAYEGRRMVRVDGGYIVLNYMAYRDRDYNAAGRMRAMRGRRKAGDALFGGGDLSELIPEDVTNSATGDEQLRNVTHAEAEANAEAELQQPQLENGPSGAVVHDSQDPSPSAIVAHRPSDVPALPSIQGKRNVTTIKQRLEAVIIELQDGTRARLKREQIRTIQAEMLFAYWQIKFNKPRAFMDDKREKLLVRRLEENKGDVSELFYVLDGALKDDWVTGKAQNARHSNDGVEFIFRDRAHVERFATRCPGYRNDTIHPMAAKYAAIFADSEPQKQLKSGGGSTT